MTPLTNEISLIEWQTDAQHCLSVAQPGGRVRVIGSSLWRPVTAGRWRETRYAMDQPKAGLTIESHNTFSVGGYLAARSIWEFVVVHEQQPLINIIVFAYDVFLPFQPKTTSDKQLANTYCKVEFIGLSFKRKERYRKIVNGFECLARQRGSWIDRLLGENPCAAIIALSADRCPVNVGSSVSCFACRSGWQLVQYKPWKNKSKG